MSIHVAIEHKTKYLYDRPVSLGPQVVRLRPAPHTRTPILSYSLKIEPEDHFINWVQDPTGNYLARLIFPEMTTEFSVTVDLVADMTVINPFDFFIAEEAEAFPFEYDPELKAELAPYFKSEKTPKAVKQWLKQVPKKGLKTLDMLVALNKHVAKTVDYSVRMEPGIQSPELTLERGIGSCRDSAWLLVHAIRHRGIAARFASGYLIQLKEDLQPVGQPPGPQMDFTDLHAWAEAYVPGAGWIGLDATSGLLTSEGHIPLACSADPINAAPITGNVSKAKTEFEFSNTITRLHEPPRVTLPYTDRQWQQIDDLGRAVDLRLRGSDARLTMGGEPTFVAAAEPDAPEWNTDALGGRKHEMAVDLGFRLAGKFASGAMIRHGQGKWYPGEPLPRWQVGVHWRADGEPLWNDQALLANPTAPGTATKAQAKKLAEALADGLGIGAEQLVPAYEDTLNELLSEAKLPGGEPPELVDPDPEDTRIADANERAKLIAKLDAVDGEPTGWALPLHRDDGADHWITGTWTLRRGKLFLTEGDSPMGLRLPLMSLTWVQNFPAPDRSTFAAVQALAEPGGSAAAAAPAEPSDLVFQTTGSAYPAAPPQGGPPITALCVELRDGHPCVFLPPLRDPQHAVDLLGLLERCAASVGTPVIIEGYAPPGAGVIKSFDVTPDPGVIEVNIHPSETWEELTEKTTVLNEEARQIGLSNEKFALDGLHTGSGGGSHITLGGRTPPDSPFLRRPDLLRSLITYWQHHPSLSYLFSGRFIGPTSQAPRVDEARHENLYELETAFQEMDRLSELGSPPAWQVDRLLRNLLTDLTGNTHRAEFCIDKMYNPGSESGRLGVVELRGFEMAPHPRMALVQALLVRALVAKHWQEPYTGELVRWGTELHDRFLLPHWVQEDIADVVDDLRSAGIRFEHEWLDPFLAFRFPVLGETVVEGVRMELRMGIEPWNVLGEEAGSGGTARYVDSSVERVQLLVEGLTEGRHAVLCNGHLVPLHATATPGTFVAGVRYRAWQPWSALHPTIGIHSPLIFDLADRWAGRSVGGCTYHVVHPGGRGYDTFPVNLEEAEARRTSRFEAAGHTPGPLEVPSPGRSGEYPRTLDLRRLPRRD